MKTYRVIGLMSGTSMDGLDIAYCEFIEQSPHWGFKIVKAATIPYPVIWQERLRSAPSSSALEFVKTDADYGHYLGKVTTEFIRRNNLRVDFISSHGHTIFHQPENGFTTQIGDGAAIAAEAGLRVINNFRALDVAYKGQGAPLVPIGDRHLFSDYDYRLNLGGFANISFEKNTKTYAFDVSPLNIALNHFAQKLNLSYDDKGEIAQKGSFILELYDQLNSLAFYKKTKSKSLGREWLENQFLPLIDSHYPIADILNTLSKHFAYQISESIKKAPRNETNPKVLITGGGAYNSFLIKCLKTRSKANLILPNDELINYKEALIFAYLGILRMENQTNVLSDVTGASRDSIGGVIHQGKNRSQYR